MRAIEITQPGPADVLRLCERPTPELKPGELLIKVHAAGVNRPDVVQRTGHYPVPPGASDLPGLEVAGEIVDGGTNGTPFKKGDMVCA
ncbi:MAG TPA: alcohol dehydrogenase catalytic domain-containing protein, partial [Burkholderiaceae bacterium]